MAYEFTFTPRFQKHFKDLTVQEKSSLKTSWNCCLRILPIRHCEQSEFKYRFSNTFPISPSMQMDLFFISEGTTASPRITQA